MDKQTEQAIEKKSRLIKEEYIKHEKYFSNEYTEMIYIFDLFYKVFKIKAQI